MIHAPFRGPTGAVGAMLIATGLASLAALAASACGARTAGIPPLPPPPHLALHGAAVAQIQRAGVLRVASDLSLPPMEFRDGGAPRGFEMDLAGLLASALGVRLDVTDTPLAVLRTGFPRGADIVISALPREEAPGLIVDQYETMGQAILSRDGDVVGGPERLRGRRVAVQAGSAGAALAEKTGAEVAVRTYLQEQALAAVAAGRVQAAVGDQPVVFGYAHDHPHLRAVPWAQTGVPLVVAVRPDAPDLAAVVSAALQELNRNGGLEQLRRRWNLR